MRAITVFYLLVSSLAAASAPFIHAKEMYNRAKCQGMIEELIAYPAQPETDGRRFGLFASTLTGSTAQVNSRDAPNQPVENLVNKTRRRAPKRTHRLTPGHLWLNRG